MEEQILNLASQDISGKMQVSRGRLCAPLAVNGGGDYAAGVTGTLAAGEETFQPYVLQCVSVTRYAYGR